jgi:hypothetical protein
MGDFMQRFVATLAMVLVAADMALAADTPLKGFSHDNTTDLFGYYLSKVEIRVGKFRLDSFDIGTLDDMKKYESGRERLPTYAPVMFSFQDTTSKQLTNENGGTYYQNEPRVLPTAYRLRGNTIAFTGTDKQVGTVTFTGTIDIKGLKAAQAGNNLSTDKVIVKGDLAIAGKVFKGVSFTWFGGD